MWVPGKQFLARFLSKWKGSFHFRLVVGLSGAILIIMSIGSAMMIYTERVTIQESAEARGLAFSRTFAMMGAPAVLDNLFVIQEAMDRYLEDPDIVHVDVIDPDNMIVAAKHPERIGTVLTDSTWLSASMTHAETVAYMKDPRGESILTIVEPLMDEKAIAAWVRITFSLARMERDMFVAVARMTVVTLVLMMAGAIAVWFALRRASSVVRGIDTRLQGSLKKLREIHNEETGGERQGVRVYEADELSQGEFEHLTDDVTETTRLLSKQSQALQELTRTLEKRVQQRTAELEIARDHALNATRLKSQFLATVSHEIRTPLNGVIGMSRLLLETALTSTQHRYAETVKHSGEALMAIINDILDFSKIEAGKLDLEVIDFDLEVVVDTVATLFTERAHGKGLELNIGIHPHVPRFLQGDPIRVHQILTNLLSNAIKFTERGQVRLVVTLTERQREVVMIRFEVSDTGIGISPKDRMKLFHSFSQLDSSTTRKYGGTGLGLAISKQLVELMAGDIGLESHPGQGSVFWFTVWLGTQPEHTDADVPQYENLKGHRVCIAGVNGAHRGALRQYLSTWGMQSVSADDGPHTFRLLHAAVADGEPFDLAILDMKKHPVEMLELARAIKADPTLTAVRLVLLASSLRRLQAEKAYHTGIVAGYLIKPINQIGLNHCLTTVMGKLDRQPPFTTGAVYRQELGNTSLVSPPNINNPKSKIHAHILVAEDDAVNQEVAVGMLQNLGCQVDLVSNGLHAVDAVTRRPYDLILMDDQMPEMDGVQATAHIRRSEETMRTHSRATGRQEQEGNMGQPQGERGNGTIKNSSHVSHSTPHIPIIAMTATAHHGSREQCVNAGMDDYLSKPVRLEDLEAILRLWIPQETSPLSEEKGPGMTRQDPALFRQASPDRPQSSDPHSLDINVLATLVEIGGQEDPDFLHRLIQRFLQETPQRLAALREALQYVDAKTVQRISHSLTGSCGHIGAGRMAALGIALETFRPCSPLQPALNLLHQLETEFDLVRAALLTQEERSMTDNTSLKPV